MAVANMVGGDKWKADVDYVTAGANLPAKTLVTYAGAVPANEAANVMGVVERDTANGDVATVKGPPSIVEVIATGTVTKGAYVEVLCAATFTTKDSAGTANVTGAGVQNVANGNIIGKAKTGGVVNETVLVALFDLQVANTVGA